MVARCINLQCIAFLFSFFPTLAFPVTEEGEVVFDIETLERLGYSAVRIDFYPANMMSLSLLMPARPTVLQRPSIAKGNCVWIKHY